VMLLNQSLVAVITGQLPLCDDDDDDHADVISSLNEIGQLTNIHYRCAPDCSDDWHVMRITFLQHIAFD